MMTAGLQIILLMFALVGFAGTGASMAVANSRRKVDGERDAGMLGVAAMLFIFGRCVPPWAPACSACWRSAASCCGSATW
jgi:hypothetical protein